LKFGVAVYDPPCGEEPERPPASVFVWSHANDEQKRRYPIHLPDEAMRVLQWHVDTQLVTPEMQESADLARA
jgi:hypothetical protein